VTGRHRAPREPIAWAPLAALAAGGMSAVLAAVTYVGRPEPIAVPAPAAAPIMASPVAFVAPAPVAASPRRMARLVGERGLTPGATGLARYLQATYPGVLSIGGVRPCDQFREHCRGIALDAMVGGDLELGDRISADMLTRSDVRFTIWRQTIRYPSGRSRLMDDRGSATANHMDHVHIQVAS
jgi:hypothetical protein